MIEERERAAAKTVVTTAREARLVMVELAAARAEAEAPAALSLLTAAATRSSSGRRSQRESKWRSGQRCTPKGTVVAA
jgi:hypothetical protein